MSVAVLPGAQRLLWPLDGVFPTSISVLSENLESSQPLFQPNSDDTGGIWHKLVHQPLTTPKTTSTEISLHDLNYWEEDWLRWYKEHDSAEYVTYSELDDENRSYPSEMNDEVGWHSNSDTKLLIACCGEDRPLRKAAKLIVKPSSGGGYITVLGYISSELHCPVLSKTLANNE